MAQMTRSRIILPLLLVAASVVAGSALLAARTGDSAPEDKPARPDAQAQTGPGRLDPASLADVEIVSVDGIADLTVVLGSGSPAVLAGDDLEIELRGDGRRIAIEGPHRHSFFGGDRVPRATLRLGRLSRIDIDGAGRVALEGPVDTLTISIDGAAQATLSGPRCEALTVRIDGAGSVDAEALPCESVHIAVDGAGKVEAHASRAAEIGLDGIGAITVHGKPAEVTVDKDGLGTVRFPDLPDA